MQMSPDIILVEFFAVLLALTIVLTFTARSASTLAMGGARYDDRTHGGIEKDATGTGRTIF